MTDRPVLFASYSGLLGGAERVLLDCATRLDRPLVIACPDGPLADAVRTARLHHVPIKAALAAAHAAGTSRGCSASPTS